MLSLLAFTLALALAGMSPPAAAALFIPSSDDVVVQTLPVRLDAAARAQRAQLARHPTQLPLALATARSAIQRARQHGDPRELGLAQAALAPWWNRTDAPPAVRLLRGTVLQSQHQFDLALADLNALAKGDAGIPLPVQAQAGLTRASVLQVTGRLADARQACDALQAARFASLGRPLSLAARACSAELSSLQGQARSANLALAALAREAPADPWLALLRAELAERCGDQTAAEALYRQATAQGADLYAVAAHADWLLDRGRPAEALALLRTRDDDADALLLRQALALHQLQDPRAAAVAQALRARFDAARQRGETLHTREEARLALDIEGQYPKALALAQANWAQQKEPADAVLLARAAFAAGDLAAVVPLQRWVAGTGWKDVRLAFLLSKVSP